MHRDIKPANILVDAAGEPRLLDLGVSERLDGRARIPPRPVCAAIPCGGSPGYAAPEQLRGDPATIGNDVFSLGVVCYELVCGHSPGEMTRPSNAACVQVSWTTPTAPSQRLDRRVPAPDGSSAASWVRALRGGLDDLVLRALEEKPAQRHRSVASFARCLRRHLTSASPAQVT